MAKCGNQFAVRQRGRRVGLRPSHPYFAGSPQDQAPCCEHHRRACGLLRMREICPFHPPGCIYVCRTLTPFAPRLEVKHRNFADKTMLSSRNSSPWWLWLALLLLGCVFLTSSSHARQDSWEDDFKKTPAPGGRTFNSTCAGCHGLDGRGSDKGANISASARVRRLSDAQVSSIISNGIPGTGMPAFHTLSARQISLLVGYLRILQGKLDARTPPGDATRGKEIFFGKGECSSCHMLSGEGGFLGPDLSAYGSSTSAKAIREEDHPSQPDRGRWLPFRRDYNPRR